MTRVGGGRLNREHLTSPRTLADGLGAGPVGNVHEQRPAVVSAEHAGEAEAVQLDRLQHLASLANAHAGVELGAPDGALVVHADAVAALAEIRPDAPARQTSALSDIA